MINRIIRLQTSVYWMGIILLAISLFILVITPANGQLEDNGLFIVNMSLTGLYFFALLMNRTRISGDNKIFHWSLLYALLLISAWALNRQMNIFETSVPWLTVMQTVVCIAIVLVAFSRIFHPAVNHICLAILGAGLPLFVYLTLYLVPLYAFSLIASIGLGVSLHSFAPSLIMIVTIVLALRLIRQYKAYMYSYLGGIAFSLFSTIIFCIQWSSVVKKINKDYQQTITNANPDLPRWLQLAQHLPQNEMTVKVLKTGIVYVQPKWNEYSFLWNVPSRRLNETSKHDPLIVVASMFATPDIDEDDRIKILESSFDARHQTQERLWSGDNLSTAHVFTNAELWPSLQIAYMEKTITVKNNSSSTAWPRQEEAIYTFYLPQGSVVSSLSLWVNGVEEKGILTTKEKAAKAYKTIVGVESRDPSIVQWQEGSTVSVRVFPVVAGSSRVFKIGVTMPMIKRSQNVYCQNVYFNGPSYSNALETIHLRTNENAEDLSVPGFFTRKNAKEYEYDGNYKNYWEGNYTAKDIRAALFSFEGKSYSIRRYQKQFEARTFNKYFLDLNQQWTKADFQQVMAALKDKDVYVNDNGISKVTSSNANELFEKLHAEKFSLFPLFDISDTDNSILVTKGGFYSPNVNDLKGSAFSNKLNAFEQSGKRIYVMDIGDELAPYLKTLREFRALYYEKATIDQFRDYVSKSSFPIDQETDSSIVLNDAELVIDRNDLNATGTAPDHLLRLFAYNNVMRQMKQSARDSLTDDAPIVSEAKQAHIVTPVSSLIVLETKEDYDRFDIHSAEKSLQNAAVNKSGAVPEPHEWAMIILFALLLLYLAYSSKSKKIA